MILPKLFWVSLVIYILQKYHSRIKKTSDRKLKHLRNSLILNTLFYVLALQTVHNLSILCNRYGNTNKLKSMSEIQVYDVNNSEHSVVSSLLNIKSYGVFSRVEYYIWLSSNWSGLALSFICTPIKTAEI